jgi:hypothetical protein
VAHWKWHYCLITVAVFLEAFETNFACNILFGQNNCGLVAVYFYWCRYRRRNL